MKILLDENIDVRFKASFPETHEIYTVRDMGWTGVKNGTMLRLLAENNFECWIVVDKNIPYQQNINNLPCLVIVLDVLRNTLLHLNVLLPRLLDLLMSMPDERLVIIHE